MAKKEQLKQLVDAASAAQGELPEGFRAVDFGFPLKNPGDSILGVYEGPGTKRKIKKKNVATFRITREDTGAEVEVLGTWTLEKFFSGVKPGQRVFIKFLGQTKGGQFGRLSEYQTAVAD